jgi:hypothetical protein
MQKSSEKNSERLMQFQLQLANETWVSVYIDNDTNNKFNYVLHAFLNIFQVTFPVKYKSIQRNKNGWITQGIKIFFEHKMRPHTHTAGTVMMQ